MITHILFDNNGVLTTSDKEIAFKHVSEFLGISPRKVKFLFDKHAAELDGGKFHQEEFYSRVLRDGRLDFPSRELMKVHLEGYVRKPEMHALAKKLRKNYELYMLSNFGDKFWSLFRRWKLNEIFSKKKVFVSSDMGMVKPDKKIYLEVLKRIDVLAENVVFIDDRLENVKSARRAGMKAIHFTNLEGLKSHLGELGVDVDPR